MDQRPKEIIVSAKDGSGVRRYFTRDHVAPWALSRVIPVSNADLGSRARLRLYRYTHDASGNEVLGNEIADAAKIAGL